MKTKYAIGIGLLIGLAVFLWEFPFTHQIDKDFPAMIATQDSDRSETYTYKPTVVHLKGEMRKKLLREPEFNVKVTVDGFDWMENADSSGPLTMDSGGGVYMGSLVYGINEKRKANGTFDENGVEFATIWFDEKFDRVQVWASTKWSGESENKARSLFITGKAGSEQEAAEVLRDLRASFEADKKADRSVVGPGSSS